MQYLVSLHIKLIKIVKNKSLTRLKPCLRVQCTSHIKKKARPNMQKLNSLSPIDIRAMSDDMPKLRERDFADKL
ncbi:MAG: hypothetical protein P8N43_00145, partial [Alphaproteobacteria bacterium]|nr:hypothetical protein [Alphaproteobacteria bacterium]